MDPFSGANFCFSCLVVACCFLVVFCSCFCFIVWSFPSRTCFGKFLLMSGLLVLLGSFFLGTHRFWIGVFCRFVWVFVRKQGETAAAFRFSLSAFILLLSFSWGPARVVFSSSWSLCWQDLAPFEGRSGAAFASFFPSPLAARVGPSFFPSPFLPPSFCFVLLFFSCSLSLPFFFPLSLYLSLSLSDSLKHLPVSGR